jgi:hypothetical protein
MTYQRGFLDVVGNFVPEHRANVLTMPKPRAAKTTRRAHPCRVFKFPQARTLVHPRPGTRG